CASWNLDASVRVLPATEAGTIVCDTLNGAPIVTPAVKFGLKTIYQDWGSATGSHPAGNGILQGAIATGLNAMSGDDLHLVGSGFLALTSMGFSIANTN